ncbi:MAG: DoxX family protein [Bacteroidota bacterium]
MKSVFQKVSFGVLALVMVVFGLNKFLGFIPVEPPMDPIAQRFLGSMFTTYLFKVVAMAEIIGGVLLMFPKVRLLGWLILSPVVFNIVSFHIAHDFIGNGIWIIPSTVFLIIGFWLKNDLFKLVKV